MIKIIKGNMFDHITDQDFVAHCISSDFALGAGIAKEINERYNVKEILTTNPSYKISFKDNQGYVLVTGQVFNLVTKQKYFHKPTYTSLENALVKLADLLKYRHIDTIHMPKIGCGLDKLDWNIVFHIICRIFTESGINVCIYSL